MDITTVVGLIAGFTLIVMGILNGGDLSYFVDTGCLLIVVGGAVAALLVSFPLADVNRFLSVIRYAFYLPGTYKRIVIPEQYPSDSTAVEGRKEDSIAIQEELKLGIVMMKRAKTYALSFGWIAFLVGIIIMLRNLQEPPVIGRGLALALLTPFYGAVIAYLICLPLQTKLARRLERLQ